MDGMDGYKVANENHNLSPEFVDLLAARTHVRAANDRLAQAKIDVRYYQREVEDAMDDYTDAVRADEAAKKRANR